MNKITKITKITSLGVLAGILIGLIIATLNYNIIGNNLVFSSILALIYTSTLVFILTLILLKVLQNKIIYPITVTSLFICFYYVSGILNLSSYRGYINELFWIGILCVAVSSLLIGYFVLGKIITKESKISKVNNKINLISVYLIITISCTISMFIILKNGFLLFNPNARFSVSPIFQYLVEFSIPAAIILFNYKYKTNKVTTLIVTLVTILLLFSLGYRNQPMILILGIALSIFISNFSYKKIQKRKLSFIVTCILVCFSFLYLIRIENADNLFSYNKMHNYYDLKYPSLTLIMIPFHLQSREAMGVTEVALDRKSEIEEYLPINSLFFQDILTALPGSQLTAGNLLGTIVNLNENVSLTPGILGGLFISFGYFGVICFFCFLGIIIRSFWTKYRITLSPYYLSVITLITIYSLELFNRGLFKPMYILVFIVLRLCVKRSRS